MSVYKFAAMVIGIESNIIDIRLSETATMKLLVDKDDADRFLIGDVLKFDVEIPAKSSPVADIGAAAT